MHLLLRIPAQELRAPLFALHAFNVETALISDQVNQPTLAQIRFQVAFLTGMVHIAAMSNSKQRVSHAAGLSVVGMRFCSGGEKR